MKHNHYFKECPYQKVDIYRILTLYNVTDPCVQHAIKKLLCCGERGAKNESMDIQEAIDTLQRKQSMDAEDTLYK